MVLTRPDGSRLVRPHQLLAFDPRGDGRIEEVFGDLDRARHLAVYVPGTGTSLDRYAGNAERASSFAAAEPDLAVVLWQDADFPDQPLDHVVPPVALWDSPVRATEEQLRAHVLSAAYRDAADRAGPALAHDVEGLRMALPGPAADLTVLGHSYGGSIVGSAEAHGMVVDRVVHISSAGGYVSDVHEYAAGECGTRRFSMTDPDDPIQLVQGAGFSSAGQVEKSLGTVAGVLPAPLRPLTGPGRRRAGRRLRGPAPGRSRPGPRPDPVGHPTGHRRARGRPHPGQRSRRHVRAGLDGVAQPARGDARRPGPGARAGPMAVELVPAAVHVAAGPGGVSASVADPHYVVTASPYDQPGYRPPVEPSTGPACTDGPSW